MANLEAPHFYEINKTFKKIQLIFTLSKHTLTGKKLGRKITSSAGHFGSEFQKVQNYATTAS